jgi:hypothetical protein
MLERDTDIPREEMVRLSQQRRPEPSPPPQQQFQQPPPPQQVGKKTVMIALWIMGCIDTSLKFYVLCL